MASTTWMPLTRFEPKSWLLGNGEVVTEPALEQTSTGRKVRVVGTTDSVFASELNRLLSQAVSDLAATKGTSVLLCLSDVKEVEHRRLGYVPDQTKSKLHLIHDPSNAYGTTICWWRFRAPKMPFEVVITATMRSLNSTTAAQNVSVSALIPSRTYLNNETYSDAALVVDGAFSEHVSRLAPLGHDVLASWREFIRDNPPSWETAYLDGGFTHPHQRAAVARLLEIVREFESYQTLQVPDFSDPHKPAWMDLELYETNVNSELVNDLTEYLDGAPTIEQAAQLYEQMLHTLRSAGIVATGKTRNDFMAALLAGEKATLNMQVLHLSEEGNEVDRDHKLSVHLPTGAFIVECNHRADHNQVAERWEEAKTIAALTGEEPELLAYARAYAKENNKRRTKGILKERRAL